jgi:hypothetical protein
MPDAFMGFSCAEPILDNLGNDQDFAATQRRWRSRLGSLVNMIRKIALMLDFVALLLPELGALDVTHDTLNQWQSRRKQHRQIVVGSGVSRPVKVVNVRQDRHLAIVRDAERSGQPLIGRGLEGTTEAVLARLLAIRRGTAQHRASFNIGIQRGMDQIANLGSRSGVVVDGLQLDESLHVRSQALDQGTIDHSIRESHAVWRSAPQVLLKHGPDSRRLDNAEVAIGRGFHLLSGGWVL